MRVEVEEPHVHQHKTGYRRADLILLMEEGRIIERGTHEELMSARGVYYEMVLRQMESHKDGDDLWG